jgi:hypothetical protein
MRPRRVRFLTEVLRSGLDRLDDLLVPGAPADVEAEFVLDLRPGWVRVRLDQSSGANDDPRNAEAALGSTVAGKGVSQRVLDLRPESLDRLDLYALDLLHRSRAGEHDLLSNPHGATPAGGLG